MERGKDVSSNSSAGFRLDVISMEIKTILDFSSFEIHFLIYFLDRRITYHLRAQSNVEVRSNFN